MSTLYLHAVHKSPLYIFPIWVFLLNGGCSVAAPPSSGSPPGFAAVRRRKDLANARTAEGNPSRGVPPDPLPPFAREGLRLRGADSLRSSSAL